MQVHALLAVLVLASGTGTGADGQVGQQPPLAADDRAEQGTAKEIKRLAAWPTVKRSADLRKEIRRLRAARVPEMVTSARAALIDYGAAVVPYLLPLLDKEDDKQTLVQMREILETVTGPPHTRLLAEFFSDRALEVRIWSLERCATLHDAGLRPALEKSLARLAKLREKADEQERLAATLCLISTGDVAALGELCDRLDGHWKRWGGTALRALEAVRGQAATELLGELLHAEKRERRLLGLRLLGGCLEETRADIVLPFLEGSDSGLRIAAINLLRQTMDGEPPLERLPVFEAIERANKWRERLK
ncbi:MAG: hypothetical protein QF724_01700 [Planctomycetota bacterium]|nr:hypothetical protein [Planctomycetota bacterium]